MNYLIENNGASVPSNAMNHVYRNADTVYTIINGSRQLYQGLMRLFNKSLGYALLSPFALFLWLLLTYLRHQIKKDINRVSSNDSIKSFEFSRTKHERLQVLLKKVKEFKNISQNEKIPFLIKFVLSPLLDIIIILDDWSSLFQKELDDIDNANSSLNSNNFKSVSEKKLWKTRNRNYSYRF